MSNPETPHQGLGRLKIARRGFLKSLTVAVGSLYFSHVSGARALEQRGAAVARSLGIPMPQYLPKNYQLTEVYTNRPDGFGKDSNEIALWYVNTKHVLGFNNPLSIYVARQPQRKQLGTMVGHASKAIALSMMSGAIIAGEYYDGFWTISQETFDPNGLIWETSNVHAVIFSLNKYSVGVMGSRLADVNVEELFRVATSLT